MQELLDQIKAQIDRYEANYKTMTIPTLLNAQDWFAIQNIRLSEFCADFKQDYNEKYYIRRIAVAQQEQHLINQHSFKQGQAQSQATIDKKNEYEEELQAQSFAYRIDLLLKAVNVLIKAIQQRISYLKQIQQNEERQNRA